MPTDAPARTLPAGTFAARARGRSVVHAYSLRADVALCGAVIPGCMDAFGDEAARVTCAGCRERMPEATPPTPPVGPKSARTRMLPSGAIEALSSNGHEVYHVTIGERESCDCPAGQHGRRCYHLTAAEQRYAAFWPVPANVTRRPVHRAARRRWLTCTARRWRSMSTCNAILGTRPRLEENPLTGAVHETVEYVYCRTRVHRASGTWSGQAWYCSPEHAALVPDVPTRHVCTPRCRR